MTLQVTPELEARLQARAAAVGVPVDAYAIEVLLRDVSAPDELVARYAESLATNGELTASSRFQEDIHQYGAEELAAMERGEFEKPLPRSGR